MLQTRKEIEDWLNKNGIENYTINDDLTVDIDGIVNFYNKGLTEIPIQFGIVNNWFDCRFNHLTSLKGCPKLVKTSFYCHSNKLLKSLEHLPFIYGELMCDNYLKDTIEYKTHLLLQSLRK
jgi:hypothetical protein